jgi:hypothetical protein
VSDAGPRRPRGRAAGAVVALAGLVAGVGLAASPTPPRGAPTPRALAPLDERDRGAARCASCHAREAAEWSRSVMAHAARSPLFGALESLVEEQVGRSDDCPHGAGVLREARDDTACRARATGLPITGSGGPLWCARCHAPLSTVGRALPAWDARPGGDPSTRRPLADLASPTALEGIGCTLCHEAHGPVGPRGSGGFEGNPTWTSFLTGVTYATRPEDARGLFGIGNSGYAIRAGELFAAPGSRALGAHLRPTEDARAYLRSSQLCGACHDVRLFGADALRGEPFKRLRDAYSEWATWAAGEARAGREAPTCQDCHMSTFPGVCVPDARATGNAGCPRGTRFVRRAPGELALHPTTPSSARATGVRSHAFASVDLPLSPGVDPRVFDDPTLDDDGAPVGLRRKRDLLLRATFRLAIDGARRAGARLEIPVVVENVGAGHRAPAGFSQEREIWVELVARDASGRVVYEVGRVERADDDLRDKIFDRVTTSPDAVDASGRPRGLFGADVRDGPDAPRWSPPPERGGSSFRGRGLVLLQNGFYRCVRCVGVVEGGRCAPLPGQDVHRADRFEDGDYDLDTGACRSNLAGADALFETYFPVGALDASRGDVRAPDAILATRSAPPGVPLRYAYEVGASAARGPIAIEARLLFRALPPYLVRAFAAYEREQARRGARPSGPQITEEALGRLEVVEIARATAEVP